jgi:hypothetical protein
MTLVSFWSIKLENKCQIRISWIFFKIRKGVAFKCRLWCDLHENLQVFTAAIPSHVSEIKATFVFTVHGKLSVYSNKPILMGIIEHALKAAFQCLTILRAMTVATWSRTWTVFSRSNTRIVGSNPTRDMDVRVFFSVCVICVSRGLEMGWSPIQGVLPTVCRIKKAAKVQKAATP